MTSALISADELKNIINDPTLKIFDATYPVHTAEPVRIPDAQVFDIDDIADPDADFAHTLPSKETFQKKLRALGLNNGDQVVAYDQNGGYMAAARAWWMFRVFGLDNVRLLNGGLNAWLTAGYDVEQSIQAAPPVGDFTAGYRSELVKSYDDIKQNIQSKIFHVLDARAPQRFEMEGHIPESQNLFFMNFMDQNTGMFKQDLKADINTSKPLAVSCGSGVTACVDALALYEMGLKDVAVYDGSWTEWSTRKNG